ncbi:MAG: ABC transporter permease [Bacteroidota bacterium]
MIKTQVLIAFRQLCKNRTSSFINIVGLALGLAAFFLILGYVAFEWSYNQMYEKGDRVFRLITTESGTEEYYATLPPGYAPFISSQFPFVEACSRTLTEIGDGVFVVKGVQGENIFRENKTVYTDPFFFSMFGIEPLEGNLDLSGPNTAVLTQSLAQKYFSTATAIGKSFSLSNQFGTQDYQVKGVVPDPPLNSDFQFNIYLSVETLATDKGRNGNDWADISSTDFAIAGILVELNDPAQEATFSAQVNKWISDNLQEEDEAVSLQAINKIHMGESLSDPLPTYGNRKLVTFLFVVAMLILSIAWFNYINLSTAQSLQRGKEVGIRKVVGATKNQLIVHYLLETLLLTTISAVLAVMIIPFIQPAFTLLIDTQLDYSIFFNSSFAWLGFMTILTGTLLAGAYVAFGLSSFMPTEVLQGRFLNSQKGIWVRKGLVITQFVISISLITCTLILTQQLHLLNSRDMGINTAQRLAIRGPNVLQENFSQHRQWFRDQMERLPYVNKYCSSGNLPGKGYNFYNSGLSRQGGTAEDMEKSYSVLFIDENYINTYEIPVKAGRTFTSLDAQKSWDADKIILNESAMKQLGFTSPEEAVGENLNWGDYGEWEVLAVLEDYHHNSLKYEIKPMIFLPGRNSGYFTLEVETSEFQTKIGELEEFYTQAFPGNPFQYEFLDETFARQYEAEQRLGSLFSKASLLAIFISALGLFGLVSFIARQRTKEIGIRKILGASVQNIVGLFSQDFLKLVGIAILIASPIAWFIANNWLKNFAYRVDIEWWVFLLAGLIAVIIAAGTVGVQSMKAAMANPVDSLRSE